ncbi:uncharacterized protein [Penaeus vannamei]|uniref:uncharacterized protein n=1 Tax=Penaeus vannamei TaxID=6689 RepID=UPI00387F3F28
MALVAVAVAAPSQPAYGYTPKTKYEEPAKYDFNYAMKDDYSGNGAHQEARDGYDTQFSYYVLLSDGRLQVAYPILFLISIKSNARYRLPNISSTNFNSILFPVYTSPCKRWPVLKWP